jgi:hypothetical protein
MANKTTVTVTFHAKPMDALPKLQNLACSVFE